MYEISASRVLYVSFLLWFTDTIFLRIRLNAPLSPTFIYSFVLYCYELLPVNSKNRELYYFSALTGSLFITSDSITPSRKRIIR